jgi:hypothetical protein
MTIDEAIKHCKEVANGITAQGECKECAEEHKQLAQWLGELKQLREREEHCEMTRCEENRKVVNNLAAITKLNPAETYEEVMPLQLGIISIILADISKSIAILADKAGSEDKE